MHGLLDLLDGLSRLSPELGGAVRVVAGLPVLAGALEVELAERRLVHLGPGTAGLAPLLLLFAGAGLRATDVLAGGLLLLDLIAHGWRWLLGVASLQDSRASYVDERGKEMDIVNGKPPYTAETRTPGEEGEGGGKGDLFSGRKRL